MNADILTIYHLTLEPADAAAFAELATEIVELSRREDDTLVYRWFISPDRTRAQIIEGYRMQGLVPHVEQTFAPFAERFLAIAGIEKLFVYGEPSDAVRAKLNGFGASYMSEIVGFTR